MSGSLANSNSISVPGFPSNDRVPGVFAVVDPSKANTATINQVTLLIGQMLSTGTAAAGAAVLSAGVGDAQAAFGPGSQLAIAVERYRALDLTGTVYCLPLADGGGATKAAVAVVFTGPATAPGTVPLYVNGFMVPCPVNAADTATTIAANAATAVMNYVTPGGNTLGVTPVAATGTLTLTAVNGGTIGNQNTVALSFNGTANGEGQPGTTNVPGVTATLGGSAGGALPTLFTGGATDPLIATALAALPAQPFDFIFTPYNDTTNLNAMQSFLGDAAGRWNWSVQLFGGAFVGKNGSLSTRTTWSTARNDQHMSAIGAYGSPSPDWMWGVDFTAVHSVSVRSDPAIPIGGLSRGMALNVVAPPLAYQDGFANRQTLLFDGMSTFKVAPGNIVCVDRAITTYQKNGAGSPDNSYLSSNTPYQLMAYIRAVETMLGTQFNQVKLVPNGSRIPPGSAMVTAATILASVVAQYRQIADYGIPGVPVGCVTNTAYFVANAQSQNAGGGVVKLLLPAQLGGQLVAIALNVQFVLT